MTQQPKNLFSLKSFLPEVLKGVEEKKIPTLEDIFPYWNDMVGLPLGKKTFPTRIEKGVLHIQAIGGAWAQELMMMQVTVLKEIQAKFPKLGIQAIKVHS